MRLTRTDWMDVGGHSRRVTLCLINSYVTLFNVSSSELRSAGKAGVMATIFSADVSLP